MHGSRDKRSLSLTPNQDDNTQVATLPSDKRQRQENVKSTQVNFLLLRCENQTPLITVTGQAAYFVSISIGTENNNMHVVICLLDTRSQLNLISKIFRLIDWPSKIYKKIQPPLQLRQTTHLKFWNKLPYTSEFGISLKPHYVPWSANQLLTYSLARRLSTSTYLPLYKRNGRLPFATRIQLLSQQNET